MATIDIPAFGGMRPAVAPRLLEDGMASYAMNVKMRDGELEPFSVPLVVEDLLLRFEGDFNDIAEAQTMYLWKVGAGNELLLFPSKFVVEKGNISEDEYHRIFVVDATGDTPPMIYLRTDTQGYYARLPMTRTPPNVPPDALRTESGEVVDDDTKRWTRFYHSWVDAYGYETVISQASDEVVYNDGDQITIGGVEAPEPEETAMKRRIYKSLTTLEGDDPVIQFVIDQDRTPGGFPAISFSILDEDAGEIAPEGDPVPDDLRDCVFVNNNFYAGFRRSNPRTVYFSDPLWPLIWPVANSRTVFDDIVRLMVGENSVFVLTKGYPWIISGAEADNMVPSKVPSAYPCVSWASACVSQNTCFYASVEGVVMLTAGSATAVLLTEKIFDRKAWRNLKPDSCVMAITDGYLLIFFLEAQKSYCIDLTADAVSMVELSFTIKCATNVIETGELIFVIGGQSDG